MRHDTQEGCGSQGEIIKIKFVRSVLVKTSKLTEQASGSKRRRSCQVNHQDQVCWVGVGEDIEAD